MNSHGFPHTHLKRACLPIPPPGHTHFSSGNYFATSLLPEQVWRALIDVERVAPCAREAFDVLLDEIPLELRVVFVLYEVEQLTSAEIADVVGVPLSTVATRLSRAREDLGARLARLEARRKFGAGE